MTRDEALKLAGPGTYPQSDRTEDMLASGFLQGYEQAVADAGKTIIGLFSNTGIGFPCEDHTLHDFLIAIWSLLGKKPEH